MPAIIDKSDFMEVQYMLDSKKASKRRAVNNNYLLSSKLTCLRCGKPMFGQSGTSRSGNKYTYYACASKSGNCGLRIKSSLLEDCVINSVKEMLDDRGTIDAMVASVLNYANSLPDATEQYTQERVSLVQRRDNLVESIAQGIPVDTVREPLLACESRIKELDLLIEREKFNREKLLSEDDVRSYMAKFVDKSDANNERGKLLVDTFINQVFVGEGVAAVVFAVGDDKPVPIEKIRELVKEKHPQLSDSEGVRVMVSWWSRITLARTIFRHENTFVLLVTL